MVEFSDSDGSSGFRLLILDGPTRSKFMGFRVWSLFFFSRVVGVGGRGGWGLGWVEGFGVESVEPTPCKAANSRIHA